MQELSTESFNHLTSKQPPKRSSSRWKPVVLTLALLGGLLGLAAFVFRQQLLPAKSVQTAQVVLLESATGEPSPAAATSAATLLFQASGWIEPDPWPVRVAVLTDGFVEAVLVQEGDAVTNGQLLARLDAADNRLALDAARLEQQTREAALTAHRASIEPVRAQLAAAHAKREKANARLLEAEDNKRRIDALDDRDTTATERIATDRAVTERRADTQVAEAEILEFQKRIESLNSICIRMSAELELAEKKAEIRNLALERTAIRSPMNGRVLKRFVEPGAKRFARMDDPNSATVVSLYDPAHLQVRVDVPLAEAGRLRVGMPARISTAMIPARSFTGEVTRIVGEADLQRNTLQTKVAIADPDPRMRPEVLCRVEFWGSDRADDATSPRATSSQRSLWVPVTALNDPAADSNQVWVVDPVTFLANTVDIQVGREERDGLRHVRQGLRANQWVVINGWRSLQPGDRVRLNQKEEDR